MHDAVQIFACIDVNKNACALHLDLVNQFRAPEQQFSGAPITVQMQNFLEQGPGPAVSWLRNNFLTFIGLIGFVGFGLGARFSGVTRFYAYALLSIVLMAGAERLGLWDPLPFFILGITIFLTGTGLLIRFLRRYPVISESANHAAD